MWEQVTEKYGDDVLPLYKPEPPFVENDNGIGFKGVLLWDSNEDKIMCNECGEWFNIITTQHLKQHGLNLKAYKEKYGYFKKTPLFNEATKQARRKHGKRMNILYRQTMLNNLSHANKRGYKLPEQSKNYYGTCDAQLKYRFEEKMKELGRRPKLEELDIRTTILRRFKSYENALASWGYLGDYAKYQRAKYTSDEAIQIMREFKIKNGREIFSSDLKNAGLYYKFFLKNFGSLTRAKELAYKNQ